MKRLLPLALILTLALTACAPPAAETPAPTETPVPSETPAPFSGPTVWTDASQLAPYEKPVSKFTRRYAGFTDTLIPAGDYGPLLPFPGAAVSKWENQWGWFDDYSLYGLMTLDGEVVADPVFSSAFHPGGWDELAQESWTLDCLVLQKVVMDENGEPTSVAALCAPDGSWCTDFLYQYDWEISMGAQSENAVSLLKGDNALAFLDPHTGEELRVVDFSKALEISPDILGYLRYNVRYDTRCTCFSDETNHYIFDTETGEVRPINDAVWEVESAYGAFSEGLCPVETSSGWGYLDGRANWVIDPVYEQAGAFQNGVALVRDKSHNYSFLDPGGKTLYAFPDSCRGVSWDNGLIRYQLLDQVCYMDGAFTPIPFPEDFVEYARWKDQATYQGGGWFSQNIAPSATQWDGVALWNYQTGARYDFLYMKLDFLERNYALLRRFDQKAYVLADLTTGETRELGNWAWANFSQDSLTGETYLTLEGQDGQPSQLQTPEGETLYETSGPIWNVSLLGGRLFCRQDDRVTLTAPDGELLFSWPIRAAMD